MLHFSFFPETLVSMGTFLNKLCKASQQCAVCEKPYVDSWLDCVKFVTLRKAIPKLKSPAGSIPIDMSLCSYDCFDALAENREFYGLANVNYK